jgi:AcrR family transcriptional regulator
VPKRNPKTKVALAKHALYRQLVLEAGERVFAEMGYEDAKVEEIAREAGLSLGTLYSVFRGKSEVFRAIHQRADEALLHRAVECVRGVNDPLELVLGGVRAYAEYFLEHPDLLRMHLREGFAWSSAESGAGSRDRTQAWSQGMEMLTRACARCIRAKVFVPGDPALFARMMIASQQVQLAHWIDAGMRPSRDAFLKDMTEHVKRAFVRS